jgi:hypothetical protein
MRWADILTRVNDPTGAKSPKLARQPAWLGQRGKRQDRKGHDAADAEGGMLPMQQVPQAPLGEASVGYLAPWRAT